MITGTYAGPSKITLGVYLDEWLRSAVRGKSPNTESAYRHGIAPAKDQLGALPLQKLTTQHVEDLVDWMLTEGRKRGGKPRHAAVATGGTDHPRQAQDGARRRRTPPARGIQRSRPRSGAPAQVKTKRAMVARRSADVPRLARQ